MQFSSLGAFALSIAATSAFKDTSPFIFFSTSEILASSPQIATAVSITKTVNAELEKCPSDVYVVVSQPGVSVADFDGKNSAPHLSRWLSGQERSIRSSFTVEDVVGEVDTAALTRTLESKCNAGILTVDASTGLFDIVDDMRPRIIKLDFPPLPSGESRSSMARMNDLFLSNLLTMVPSPNYTVIYTTTPLSVKNDLSDDEPTTYQMDTTMSPLVHMDLKRDLSMDARAASGNSMGNITLVVGPLFEKYQFFTPGIFMGLIVTFILLSILYVALSAISGLQVSYAAFDKEMGPAAVKKQQQQ